MKRLILLIVMILALYTPVHAQGAVYYVSPTGSDSNSGAIGSPWRTLQKAAGYSGTIYVAPGNYASFVSKVANTTLIANGGMPVIDGGAGTCVYISHANITIDGFEIRNCGTSGWTRGIYVTTGGDNAVIQNNRIYNAYAEGVFGGWSAKNILIQNNVIYGNGMGSNGGSSIIMYYAGSGGRVLNNQLYGNGNDLGVDFASGIEVCYNGQGTLIDGNVIHDNAMNGVDICGSASGVTVSNNVVYGNHNVGIGLDNGTSGNIIKNNVVYNNVGSQGWGGGIFGWCNLGAISNNQFLNNTVYGNSPVGIGDNSCASGTEARYNIAWNNGADLKFLSAAQEDYNDGKGGKGANDKAVDPLFINPPADFHLQPSSPVIGWGAYGVGTPVTVTPITATLTPTNTATRTPTATPTSSRTPTVTPTLATSTVPVPITSTPACFAILNNDGTWEMCK